jgi:hypothetical protein
LAYVMAGIGVSALGVFTALTVDGASRYSTCDARGCSQATVDGLSVERYVAFGALGVGALALGTAAWLFFVRPSHGARGGGIAVTPAPFGAKVDGRF